MTIEALITEQNGLMRELIAAVKANGGAAAVNTSAGDAADTVKKATWFHLVDKKQVVKIDAGGERPLGGLEVTAAEAKKLEEKYKADAAKNDTPTGQAAGQTQASGTTDTGSGPSFQDVTGKITELSKKPAAEGGGRDAVLKLFEKWGVKTFPEANGKKPNAELIADIQALLTPKADDAGMGDLGL